MKTKSNKDIFTADDVNILELSVKFNGFFKIHEYRLSHKLFNGGESAVISREIFERGDAVVVIPYDPVRDTLVFNEQFRPGALRTQSQPWLLEFVAGMFDINETPEQVAIREAKEEANLDIDITDLEPVMSYLSSPGGTSEEIHLYVANVNSEGVEGIFGLDEEAEDIRISAYSRCDALRLLEQGKINNASTVIGLQWIALHGENLRKKWLNNENNDTEESL